MILFLTGRGDFYEKYLETLDHWHGQGWQVTAIDWRGQGGSGRLGGDAFTGHIDDFATWVNDLAAFWEVWRRETPGPHVAIGHSMGGHLLLRACAEARVDPDAAVLVAPMLDFAGPRLPMAVMQGLAWLATKLGDPRRPAWKWSEKPGQVPVGRGSLLTHDATRYADELWWREHRPEVVMGPGSWGWVERAYASMRRIARASLLETVRRPVLVLAARHDRLVGFKAIRRAVSRMPQAELVAFGDEASHELLREADGVRDRALGAIESFLARVLQ